MSSPRSTPGPRVLHVSEFLQGGTATYLNELLPEQRRRFGAGAVTVVLPSDHVELLRDRDDYRLVPYRRTGRDPASFRRLVAAVRREVATTAPDLVHLHGTVAGTLARVAIGLQHPRPKVVYCAHGWSFLREASPPRQRAAQLLERSLAPLADAIISISNTEHAAALRAGLPADRCCVVRHGLSDVAEPITHAPAGDGVLRLLFLGRHDRQKGLDVLLGAFERLDPGRFTLSVAGAAALGDADGAVPRVPAGVALLGWCDPAAVDALLQRHDVVVVPSRWEGFGLVALEAMRRGVAVVASRRGALPEVVDGGVTGWLFDPVTPDALARCLASLDPVAVRAAGRRGRERFEQHFRVERMSRETLALYGELLQVDLTGGAGDRVG